MLIPDDPCESEQAGTEANARSLDGVDVDREFQAAALDEQFDHAAALSEFFRVADREHRAGRRVAEQGGRTPRLAGAEEQHLAAARRSVGRQLDGLEAVRLNRLASQRVDERRGDQRVAGDAHAHRRVGRQGRPLGEFGEIEKKRCLERGRGCGLRRHPDGDGRAAADGHHARREDGNRNGSRG